MPRRVLDEIILSEVVGDRKFVTAEDIEQLQYMEQVHQLLLYQETLLIVHVYMYRLYELHVVEVKFTIFLAFLQLFDVYACLCVHA